MEQSSDNTRIDDLLICIGLLEWPEDFECLRSVCCCLIGEVVGRAGRTLEAVAWC